jgi:hypothetical protein
MGTAEFFGILPLRLAQGQDDSRNIYKLVKEPLLRLLLRGSLRCRRHPQIFVVPITIGFGGAGFAPSFVFISVS